MPYLRQSGMTLPRLGYSAAHFNRTIPILAKLLKRRQNARLNMVLNWAEISVPRHYRYGVKLLIEAAARNPHCNHYHHQWHTMMVMISAAILARRARLNNPEMTSLMIHALVHDLGHRGRMMPAKPYAEEHRAAAMAERRLYRRCSDGARRRQLKSRLEETSFSARGSMMNIDELGCLLIDADVLASCFLPRADVLAMARSVMREQGQAISAETAYKGFLKNMAKHGFAHPVTRHLALTMVSRCLGVYIDPPSAKALGFKAASP
jgi:hypothetical protein